MNILEHPIRKIFAVWLFAWLSIVGGAIYLLPEARIDHPVTFHIVSIYYLIFILIGGYYYGVTRHQPHQVAFRIQFLQITLFSAALIGICLALEAGLPVEGPALNKILQSRFYFPLFRSEILITKFFDISFQQVFIVGVLLQLKKLQLSDQKSMILFSIAFFLLHLPLAASIGAQAVYFIVPSLLAGAVFSFLILKVRFGLFASFAAHFLFYFLIGLWLRMF